MAASCQIEIESEISEREIEAKALGDWLPNYVPYYGAQRVEIDGRPVPCNELQLREALFTLTR